MDQDRKGRRDSINTYSWRFWRYNADRSFDRSPGIPTVESVIVDSGGATQYRITDLAGNPLFNENRSDYIVNLPEKYASWKIASTNISFQRLGGTITSSQDGKVFMLTHTNSGML